MHYKCALSFVRPSLIFHIFDFSYETVKRNSAKLNKKQDINVLYQVCFFFFGRSEKRDGQPGLWMAQTFLNFSSETPEWNSTKSLTGIKISTSSTKFVYFGPISKQKWPPWLIREKGGTFTQVHDSWSFRPHVFYSDHFSKLGTLSMLFLSSNTALIFSFRCMSSLAVLYVLIVYNHAGHTSKALAER